MQSWSCCLESTSHWFLCSLLVLRLGKPRFPTYACSKLSIEIVFAFCFIYFTYLFASFLFDLRNTAYLLPMFISFSHSTDLLTCLSENLLTSIHVLFPPLLLLAWKKRLINFNRHCLLLKCLIYEAYTNFVMVGGLVCCNHWLSCWSVQVVSWFHTGSVPVGVHFLLGLDRAWPDAILSEVVQVENNLLVVSWSVPI